MTDAGQHALAHSMSLGEARLGGEPRATNNDLSTLASSHRGLLAELRLVTTTVARNAGLHALINQHIGLDNGASCFDADDVAWINANELLSGHHYDDASLPFPPISIPITPIYDAKPNRPLNSPSGPISDSRNIPVAGARPSLPISPSSNHRNNSRSFQNTPEVSDVARTPQSKASVIIPSPDDGSLRTETAVTTSSHAKVNDSAVIDLEQPSRPTKVVHLPSEREQEARMIERHRAVAEDHHNNDQDRGPRRGSHLQLQIEQASSPSSTVGAYSATTPMPPQESPDTSPNSEVDDVDMLAPKELRPTPEEKAAQEEHDRLLEAQKEIARRAAMGDDVNPSEQLRWEEREAAAREAHERAAKEKVTFSAGDVLAAIRQGQLDDEQIANEEGSKKSRRMSNPSKRTSKSASTEPANEQEGDNITVCARALPTTPANIPAKVQDDVSKRKDPAPADQARILSPDTHRQKPDGIPRSSAKAATTTGTSPAESQLSADPRRFWRQLPIHPLPPKIPKLSDLAPLKGAADDPDRDYLEPLFRIQAHDSPNARTQSLPNLVKDAAKCLSTEDHYTTLHERLDYRILRRIYQLQNANKWSLRQMDKSREPESPVTHLDYMMAEMRWMRKDFKAERKMKTSVCAWLAQRCAAWVAASPEERRALQVQVKKSVHRVDHDHEEALPDLDQSTDSAAEDEAMPSTPQDDTFISANITIAPDLVDVVHELQMTGKLGQALRTLPVMQPISIDHPSVVPPMAAVSKFVTGKVLPTVTGPIRKRSRFDYEDDCVILDNEPDVKRARESLMSTPAEQDVALFHPDNKHIRDRLHANNAFRPPSEFVMPSTAFYEFRNGSQWIWEDDQKLRKLAKEYTFNWSLIADEMSLSSRQKSSVDRRTPWECFERWVELETLPAEMRKTMYFKTWYQRLEQSQQAAERRYQLQVAAIQQAQNGQAPVPTRRRTTPTRVEKRKNSRYLWLVDAMRKLARKRETNAYKQADSQRLAAQRKAQADNNQQPRGQMPTPQEFSKRRYERDLSIAEAQRQHRQNLIEKQQRQLSLQRAQAQQQHQQQQQQHHPQQQPQPQQGHSQHAVPQGQGQQMANMGQRPIPGTVPAHMNRVNTQQLPNGAMQANGQGAQTARTPVQMRNGQTNAAMMNGQSMPAGQMRPASNMSPHVDMQRMAHANAQRNVQYANQAYHIPNGQMISATASMTGPQQQAQTSTTPQPVQGSPAMMAHMAGAQPQQVSNTNGSQNGVNGQGLVPNAGQQAAVSPGMHPPPTPHSNSTAGANQLGPQQLSSGHVPALFAIKSDLRAKNPQWTDEQLTHAATYQLSQRSSSTQARQSAMNAAAGIHGNNVQQFAQHQPTYTTNAQMVANSNTPQANVEPGSNPQTPVPNAQTYAAQIRQRQMQMMRMQQSQQQQSQQQQQSSPSGSHAQLNGSPIASRASPNMAPASPSMLMNNGPAGSASLANSAARPPSRSNTPQMQRVQSGTGSSNVAMSNGMQSPGALQSSPRSLQANMAR